MSNMKAHIKIVIDTVTLFDGDLDEWSNNAPPEITQALQPNAKPQPWMKAILVAMADAALVGENVTIEAWTKTKGKWSMEVRKKK